MKFGLMMVVSFILGTAVGAFLLFRTDVAITGNAEKELAADTAESETDKFVPLNLGQRENTLRRYLYGE